MTTRASLLAALCALVVVAGCGDDDGPPSSRQITTGDDVAANPASETAATPPAGAALAADDKRGVALTCIRDQKGIDARAVGEKQIAIGSSPSRTRIDFFQSSLEAEGEQFEGRAEGASQIGAALLYVREAPEDQLIALEECLNEQ
jgi:hypothetical protein